MARLRSITARDAPRNTATPFTWGCDSGILVSAGQGMISLTFSRLIAISLPLRKVNSRSESESARALFDDIKTFWRGSDTGLSTWNRNSVIAAAPFLVSDYVYFNPSRLAIRPRLARSSPSSRAALAQLC